MQATRPVSLKPTTRDPGRTRQAIVDAAFEEFYRSGYRGSDIDAILLKVGVTKGALYHHFDSKAALGYAVLDETVTEIMCGKWQLPLEAAADPIDALIEIIQSTSLQPEHLACGCPLNKLSEEMSPLDEGFRTRTAKVFKSWHDAIAAALAKGKNAGSVRQDVDPDETAAFLIAAYEGYLSLAKSSQDAGGLKAGLTMLVRFLESMRPSKGGRNSAWWQAV